MYRSKLLMQYKSFIDQSETMKVESHQSDSEDDQQAYKSETKPTGKAILDERLTYPPNNTKGEKDDGQGGKAQSKSEVKVMKNEMKMEKALKKALVYNGQSDKKKEIQRLAYPPPEKQIPLKASKFPGRTETKASGIVEETILEAKHIIHVMKIFYKKDLDKFSKGELAYHKVKYLKTLSEKLSNAYVKKQFIEHNGLKQMERWLERIVNQEKNEFQPSLALRLGITKILKDMNLTPDQIEKTKYLMSYVQRNRMSQVQELRELSIDLVKQWEYNIMTENNHENKK